ncbi:hypothetical protein OG963_00655 [Streptomyces sp. NBC_01707]|uniref:hypothetical protein n=1 Tax=unclassified Streptomyces TaxID=2593676 RepID=UPI002E118F25|nr:hypothetical protein OG763_43835 [Streptomyces sp. NBC_01230]
MKKIRVSLVVGAMAGMMLLGGALMANASADGGPLPADNGQAEKAAPTPEWVNPDGTVDESKMPEELPLIGADGKPVKDENGKTLMVKTRVKISQPDAPQAPVAGPRAVEKRSTSTDAEGRKTETVEIKPSVPPAH